MHRFYAVLDEMEDDDRYNDKWGPALCIEILDDPPRPGGLKRYVFFGIASS